LYLERQYACSTIKDFPRMIALSPLSRALALACLCLSAARAQTPDEALASSGTVVVTATRGAKAVDKIPGAITVIGQQELAAQYLIADDPSQALATYVPGYAPSRQKMSSAGESLRGRQPLILLDGIPQSNPLRAGSREGYFADSAIIERIEVINGASAMQGMGATGGIINYITKSARTDGTRQGLSVRASGQLRSDNLDWKTGYHLSHKDGGFDLLAYVGMQRRAMGYDGHGRRLGIDNVQGDTLDSHGDDLFFKIGQRVGAQRVQLSLNRFALGGDGDYRNEAGVPAAGLPTTSLPGRAPGTPPKNKVRSASLDYRYDELLGGAFGAQFFMHDFEALYGATPAATFQDADLAPIGALYDQSQIVAAKRGARMSWVGPDLLLRGLELTLGLDLLRDNTQQRLASTNRTWVPQLRFASNAPFAQFEYEAGPLTVRGGVRHEQARLGVDSYTTLAAYGKRQVSGGDTAFSKSVKNIGAVWRFAPHWSAFVASAEGFGLPDVGLVLRGVNSDGKSVATLIDLQPIVTRNQEVGLNWRGASGQLGISRYDSRSKLGSVLRVSAAGIGAVERVPTVVKGWEVSGDWRALATLSLFGSYAATDGKTAATQGAPLDLSLAARAQGPDKGVLGANWQWAPAAQLRVQAAHLRDRDINIGRTVGSSRLEEHFRGYTLADVALTVDSAYGRIGVSLENLFDKQYVGYYSQSTAALDAAGTYAGRGRTLALSLSRSW
jgi:iron complex outermembrane receptor protein